MTLAPGWYDDPGAPGKERWWDGHSWTRHVRHDVPDIPLAPWVDPSHPAVVVDATPPRRPGSLFLSIAVGVLGVALVTGIGASATLSALRATGVPGGEVVAPPSDDGAPVLPLYSCGDVAATTLRMARQHGDLPVVRLSEPTALADHQPIRSLPDGEELYLVLACVAEAEFSDGHVGEVEMSFAVDSAATIWVDYRER